MPLTEDDLNLIKSTVASEVAALSKVRIPELPQNVVPISMEDRLPVWVAADNKTRYQTIQDLYLLMATGGGEGSTPDTGKLGQYTFDVSAAQAGTNTVSLPQFAGKNFTLSIEGRPLLDNEYTVLSSGGFTVDITDYELQEDQRVTLGFAEPIASTGGPAPSVSGGFIKGAITVSVSTTLTGDDSNKLIQIRGGSSAITVTLPDLSSVPENGFFILETLISNSKQQAVTTQGGQLIYLNNTSRTTLYLGLSEKVALYRGSDGWYVLNDFDKIYTEVGKKFDDWTSSLGLNELLLDGSLKNRADYPRLWEKVQTFGSALVSDSEWNLATATTVSGQIVPFPNRGKWSSGDGSTTFRVPDFGGMSVRGLQDGSTDDERTQNHAGNYQKNALKKHNHKIYGQDNDAVVTGSASPELANAQNPTDPTAFIFRYTETVGDSEVETRMDNIGMYWKIKC